MSQESRVEEGAGSADGRGRERRWSGLREMVGKAELQVSWNRTQCEWCSGGAGLSDGHAGWLGRAGNGRWAGRTGLEQEQKRAQ